MEGPYPRADQGRSPSFRRPICFSVPKFPFCHCSDWSASHYSRPYLERRIIARVQWCGKDAQENLFGSLAVTTTLDSMQSRSTTLKPEDHYDGVYEAPVAPTVGIRGGGARPGIGLEHQSFRRASTPHAGALLGALEKAWRCAVL